MKKLISTMVVLAAIGGATSAHAADKKVMMPIAGGLAANDAQGRLDDGIKFVFGKQSALPKGAEKLGSDKTSAKTNAFAKSDEKVCNWAFLSAMLSLQKRAKDLGADGVVNIVSNYGNVEMSSETEFECHVGNIVGGVALKADFVRMGGKK